MSAATRIVPQCGPAICNKPLSIDQVDCDWDAGKARRPLQLQLQRNKRTHGNLSDTQMRIPDTKLERFFVCMCVWQFDTGNCWQPSFFSLSCSPCLWIIGICSLAVEIIPLVNNNKIGQRNMSSPAFSIAPSALPSPRPTVIGDSILGFRVIRD